MRARPFRCAAPSRLICHSRRLQLIVPAAAVVVVGGAVRALSVWALCVKRLACVALRILSCLLGKYYVLRYLDIFSERTVKPRNRVVQHSAVRYKDSDVCRGKADASFRSNGGLTGSRARSSSG